MSVVVKKILIFSCFIVLFFKVIEAREFNVAEQCRIQPLLPSVSLNFQNKKYGSRLEGFAQGTLVKTENGCVSIEALSSGDVIEGKNGNQKIICVQKNMGQGV